MNRTCAAVVGVLALAAGSAIAATRNGDLDPSFGTDGQTLVDIGDGSGFWASMTPTADGRFLLAGTTDRGAPTGPDFIVARLNADGSIDNSFSFDGRVDIPVGPDASVDDLYGILEQSNGRIVLAGRAKSPIVADGDDMAVVRLTAAGVLDGSFGVGGKVFIDFGLGGASVNEQVLDVVQQPDGRLVVVGSTPVTDQGLDMALVRLNVDGTRDTSFGTGGRVTVRFSLDDQFLTDSANAVAIDSANRIVVAGLTAKGSSDTDFAVARLLPNGQLDGSFGGDGRVTVAFDLGDNLADGAFGLLLDADDSITVVGAATDVGYDMAIARLRPDGSLDTAFGGDGRVTVPFDLGGTHSEFAIDTLRVEGNRLLVVGIVQPSSTEALSGAVQLLPDGNLDPAFGIGGKTVTGSGFGGTQSAATTIRLVDGRAVLGGLATDETDAVGLLAMAMLVDVLFADSYEDD